MLIFQGVREGNFSHNWGLYFFWRKGVCFNWVVVWTSHSTNTVRSTWPVVSNIFYFHPYLERWSNLTNIFQMGWKPPTSQDFWALKNHEFWNILLKHPGSAWRAVSVIVRSTVLGNICPRNHSGLRTILQVPVMVHDLFWRIIKDPVNFKQGGGRVCFFLTLFVCDLQATQGNSSLKKCSDISRPKDPGPYNQ